MSRASFGENQRPTQPRRLVSLLHNGGSIHLRSSGRRQTAAGAFARQPTGQQSAAAARRLDAAVVILEPSAHLMTEVPGGVAPDQRQHPHAVGGELPGHPGEEGAGHRADRPPLDEAQQHPLALGQVGPRRCPTAVAGQRLRLGVGTIRGSPAKAQGLARRPCAQDRLGQAGEPDLVREAERPARPTRGQPDQAVAAPRMKPSCGFPFG